MTDYSRWTKANLIEALERADSELTKKAEQTQVDPEASVIAQCAKALDYLHREEQQHNRNSSASMVSSSWAMGYGGDHYNSVSRGPLSRVERVLEYLRTRYGLPDPQAELRAVMQRSADRDAELNRVRARLAEIESSVTGRPIEGRPF